MSMKKKLKQWLAALLAVVLIVMTPLQSAAGTIGSPLLRNHANSFTRTVSASNAEPNSNTLPAKEPPYNAATEDEAKPEISTPSHVEKGTSSNAEKATSSNAEPEKGTPSNLERGKLAVLGDTYVVKFYVDSELWDTQQVVKDGCAEEPDVPVKEGYTFLGWQGDYTRVERNLSIKARFIKGAFETHRVTFLDYDGRWLQNPLYIVDGDDANRPSNPKRDGYTFVGWDKQRFVIRKDTLITAQYREGDLKTYFLTYWGLHPNKSNSKNLLRESWVVEGESDMPPIPAAVDGYTFKWWNSNSYINVNRNASIYADYYTGDVNTFKVEFIDYDGTALSAPQFVISGDDANRPPSPKRDGYTFVGWDKQRFVIRKDTLITAQYREGDLKTYFLTYRGRHPNKSGGYNFLRESWVVEGESDTPPIPAAVDGYTFKWWNSYSYINVKGDASIYADYYTGDVKTYKVEFIDYDGTALLAPQHIISRAAAIPPPNPEQKGYTFTGWDKTPNRIIAPIKIRAVYIPGIYDTHTVKFYGKIAGETSWILLKEERVPVGGDAHAPIPSANTGYVFTGWESSYTNIRSNKNIFASYKSEDSISGALKFEIFKQQILKMELPEDLEEELLNLGLYLAQKEDGGPSTRIVVDLAVVIVVLAIAAFGAVLAKPVLDDIAECITTSFGEFISGPIVKRIKLELEKRINEGDSETPDVKYPGDDPTVSPGEGWEWRGPADKGSWYKPETGETLHPDLNHPAPEGPHWDYIPYKNGPQYRVHPDGTVVPKG